uniref:Putative epoxide hydrolase 3 n=1 Tax=Linum usitatissimum TaxID=4006 RepID=I6YI06_LINUS|nr:putative epoxide hydrolase 3 [Linum usitatissimum]AND01144.1 putative epoxide hydrolase 3 [Linum usitatissimum]
MEKIQHKFVEVEAGLKLHVADIGSGDKAVLFLHGFPEIWYSWRYQMLALSSSGHRAIAVDYRGFGLSDHPLKVEDANYVNIVADLVAILDSLAIPKVVLIGKDWGAFVASWFGVLHPDRVSGIVTLGIPLAIPGSFLAGFTVPEGVYTSRWGEPGRAEVDFGRLDAKTVIRNVYILFSGSDMPTAAENQEIMDLVDPATPLPSWFSDKDLSAYGALYQKSGFQFALQIPYRSFQLKLDMPKTEQKLNMPALLIMGAKDYCLKFPGIEDYIHNDASMKEFVPDLKTVFMDEGNHFVQEQLPEQVNHLILGFLEARISP